MTKNIENGWTVDEVVTALEINGISIETIKRLGSKTIRDFLAGV